MMGRQLDGQTAVVVGSAPIGNDVGAALAAEGAYALDLSCADPEEVVWRMEDVDILIDVGGCFRAMPFTGFGDEDWTSVFDENVVQAARFARLAIPGMLTRNRGVALFMVGKRAVVNPWDFIHQEMVSRARLAMGRELSRLVSSSRVVVEPMSTEMAECSASEGLKDRSVPNEPNFTVSEIVTYVADLLRLQSRRWP